MPMSATALPATPLFSMRQSDGVSINRVRVEAVHRGGPRALADRTGERRGRWGTLKEWSLRQTRGVQGCGRHPDCLVCGIEPHGALPGEQLAAAPGCAEPTDPQVALATYGPGRSARSVRPAPARGEPSARSRAAAITRHEDPAHSSAAATSRPERSVRPCDRAERRPEPSARLCERPEEHPERPAHLVDGATSRAGRSAQVSAPAPWRPKRSAHLCPSAQSRAERSPQLCGAATSRSLPSVPRGPPARPGAPPRSDDGCARETFLRRPPARITRM